MASIRQEKMSALVKQELATLFVHEGKDLLEGAFITVTVVRVSPDMGHAKVYLSLFAVKDKEATLEMIKRKTPAIRGLLGKRIGKTVRVVPDLDFYIDDSLDRAEEIDDLLKR